jgi:hypothetical protein
MVDGLVRENFEKKKKKNSLNLKENSPERQYRSGRYGRKDSSRTIPLTLDAGGTGTQV